MKGRRELALALLLAGSSCARPAATQAPQAPAPVTKPAAKAAAPAAANAAASIDPNQFLAGVSVETSAELGQGELAITLPRYKGQGYGELTSRGLVLRDAGGKVVLRREASYVASQQAVASHDRRCSFVVDCDDLGVMGLTNQLREQQPNPSAADVTAFVGRYIDHKHMARNFDIASVVARRHEGDCTEHAVLTTALLRSLGFPSHIVTGIALVRLEGQVMAFGHAWSEYHDGQSWQLADATNVAEKPERILYLALHVMSNEGPGYGRELFEGFDVMDVETVLVPTGFEPPAP